MPPQGSNVINNYALRETLANAALSTLRKGTDYTRLEGLSCTFGYLFEFPDHGVEALFFITTDCGRMYFAAQGDTLKQLALNEEQFRAYQQTFLDSQQHAEADTA